MSGERSHTYLSMLGPRGDTSHFQLQSIDQNKSQVPSLTNESLRNVGEPLKYLRALLPLVFDFALFLPRGDVMGRHKCIYYGALVGRILDGISKTAKFPGLGTYVVILLLFLHPGFTSPKEYTIATGILEISRGHFLLNKMMCVKPCGFIAVPCSASITHTQTPKFHAEKGSSTNEWNV